MDATLAESRAETDPTPSDPGGSPGLRPADPRLPDALVGWYGADGRGPYLTGGACLEDGGGVCRLNVHPYYRLVFASANPLVRSTAHDDTADASHSDGDPHADPEADSGDGADPAASRHDSVLRAWLDSESTLPLAAAGGADANSLSTVYYPRTGRYLHREQRETWRVWDAGSGRNAGLGGEG